MLLFRNACQNHNLVVPHFGCRRLLLARRLAESTACMCMFQIRLFIHHEVVLPEERRIMAKKSFCLFMPLLFDSGFRCWLLTRSASCLPFALLLMLLTLLAYTIIPIKIALFLLIQIESYIVPERHLEPWVLLTFGGNVWEVVVVQSCFQNGKFHPHPHGANLYLLLNPS